MLNTQADSGRVAQSFVSLLAQGNTETNKPRSAISTFQAHLESKTYNGDALTRTEKAASAFVAGSTWFVRQTLTPAMAVVELGVRVTQFVLVALFNFFSGSMGANAPAPIAADSTEPVLKMEKYREFAQNVRETNKQLGHAAISAFFAIFAPLAGTVCGASSVVGKKCASSCAKKQSQFTGPLYNSTPHTAPATSSSSDQALETT